MSRLKASVSFSFATFSRQWNSRINKWWEEKKKRNLKKEYCVTWDPKFLPFNTIGNIKIQNFQFLSTRPPNRSFIQEIIQLTKIFLLSGFSIFLNWKLSRFKISVPCCFQTLSPQPSKAFLKRKKGGKSSKRKQMKWSEK